MSSSRPRYGFVLLSNGMPVKVLSASPGAYRQGRDPNYDHVTEVTNEHGQRVHQVWHHAGHDTRKVYFEACTGAYGCTAGEPFDDVEH